MKRAVCAGRAEDEQVSAERILPEHVLDLAREPVKTPTHVGRAGREPDACADRWRDHPRSAARIRRSARPSTCWSTRPVQPFGSVISTMRSTRSAGRGYKP